MLSIGGSTSGFDHMHTLMMSIVSTHAIIYYYYNGKSLDYNIMQTREISMFVHAHHSMIIDMHIHEMNP